MECAFYCVGGRSILGRSDHILALVAEYLKRFVEDRSKLREDRATANATGFVVLHLWFGDAHPIHFPIDVLPTQRQRFRRCSKPTEATQAQDPLQNWVCLLHQLVDDFPRDELVDLNGASLRSNLAEWILVDDPPVDGIVHKLPRELDPLVDRRRGHPLVSSLSMKSETTLFRWTVQCKFRWVFSMTGKATICPWKRCTLKQP